jgi:hypothetical protein
MTDGLDRSLASARRARPVPLPAGFADRVIHEARRQSERLPHVFTRAGLAASFAAAILIAGAVTWEFSRPASPPTPPRIGAFSPTLLTP